MITRHATLAEACRAARRYSAEIVPTIFLGCDGRYWLTHGRKAGDLRRAGYEQVGRFDWID